MKDTRITTYVVETYVLGLLQGLLIPAGPFKEHARLLWGPRARNLRVIARHGEALTYVEQSAGGLETTFESVAQQLIRNIKHGNPLVAIAHSHPGNSAWSVGESNKDVRFMRLLQEGFEAEVLGIIFNMEGYVHFFNPVFPFRLLLSGTGYTVIDEVRHVYKLEEIPT